MGDPKSDPKRPAETSVEKAEEHAETEKPMENYYAWLAFCTIGMVSTLALYGLVLEYATSGGRKLHEVSFVFVTTSIYSMTAYLARETFNEKPTDISKYQMLILSVTSIASTITSVRSLRYVIYPVQVLFKSCKPVPVMLFGTILGKKYALRKYVNVIIITLGVALFMGAGSSTRKPGGSDETTLMGGLLLSISLCFDGATGAYEDKLMSNDHVEPFDLMYNIQLGKAVISFCTLVATNGLGTFIKTIYGGGFTLIVLGLTGALGQVFVFMTIAKFGALNCALIGLVRKILSLLLSFVLYGHTLNAFQTIGLVLSLVAMISNFYEKGGGGGHGGHGGHGKKASEGDRKEAVAEERVPLMVEDEEPRPSKGGKSVGFEVELTQSSAASPKTDALRHFAKVSSSSADASVTPAKPEPNLLDLENPTVEPNLLDAENPQVSTPAQGPTSPLTPSSGGSDLGITVDALRLTPNKGQQRDHPHRAKPKR